MNNVVSIGKVRGILLRWFLKNARRYPWRETKDPYKLLIAEMMLQRTKADQVVPVYYEFINKFPNSRCLANSRKTELKRILKPLGLPNRIDNFNLIGRIIEDHFNGMVPDSRYKLKTLPGVGDYIAGAVLSIGFNKKEWIVDTNVVRVFKRYFGLTTSNEARRDRQIIELAMSYSLCNQPKKANLALLDLSALICKSSSPICILCPLRKNCKFINMNVE